MKLFRYRKPSINTLLGITKAKKEIKKDLGIYKITKILNYPNNFKRKVLRNAGYYSEPMKTIRNGIIKPGGCVVSVIIIIQFMITILLIIKITYEG